MTIKHDQTIRTQARIESCRKKLLKSYDSDLESSAEQKSERYTMHSDNRPAASSFALESQETSRESFNPYAHEDEASMFNSKFDGYSLGSTMQG